MSNFEVQAKQRFSCEVLVVGDGVAATTAALAAAAAGKSTMLAAAGPALAAEITVAMHGEFQASEDPYFSAIRQRVGELGGEHDGWLDPDVTQLVVDRMMSEAGVQVLLYAIPIRSIEQDGRATGVLMTGKDGFYTIAAGAVVDATQDGALFRNSGVGFTVPETITASRHLFFAFAGDDLSSLPDEAAGFSLSLRRTWPGQACLTLTAPAAYDGQPAPSALHRASRLAEQDAAKVARAAVPGLPEALATHSGHQMIPHRGVHLTTPDRKHPRLSNLLGAGAWVSDDDYRDLAALASGGTAAGTLATEHLAEVAAELPQAFDLQLTAEQVPVAVLGGGTAGPFAALAAARNGAGTVIFESGWSLGGISTCGGIHCYYHGLPGGLQDAVDADTDGRADDLGGKDRVGGFHPEARKIAFESALQEARAEARYGWTAVDAITVGERVQAVIVARPGELLMVEPQVVIDATGDGDVAAKAGAPIMYGRETDGVSHQYSQSAAQLDNGKLGHYNFDAGYVDPRSVEDLTRGRRHALQLYWREQGFGGEKRPFNISYLLGLRQSRQVVCDHVLSLADQVANRHFDDVVAYTSGHQDNHAFDYQNENDESMLWCWGLGFWKRVMQHQLPYRSLIPRRLSNVLVACRAVGLSREAHMLFRMIRDMHRVGEAAGTAAALALDVDGEVRRVNVDELQARLRETGALLAAPPAEVAVGDPEELVATLVDGEPRVAVWSLYQHGEQAVPALLKGLRSDNEHMRWWSAVALAMVGKREAADELLSVLEQRDERRPTVDPEEPSYYLSRMAPRWLVAVALLGRLQEPRGAAPITALLGETFSDPNIPLTLVRALGRIGDPAAVEALRRFVESEDLPVEARIHGAHAQGAGAREDVAWQVHLATAEALQRLGVPAPELIEPYLKDSRAYVREYAARLV